MFGLIKGYTWEYITLESSDNLYIKFHAKKDIDLTKIRIRYNGERNKFRVFSEFNVKYGFKNLGKNKECILEVIGLNKDAIISVNLDR